MVPTAEARITRQMLYSALPLTAIASIRLAMLSPVIPNLAPARTASSQGANCGLKRQPWQSETHEHRTGYPTYVNAALLRRRAAQPAGRAGGIESSTARSYTRRRGLSRTA